MLVPLSRGLYARVNEADFAELSRYKWSTFMVGKAGRPVAARKERQPSGRYRTVYLHRQLLGLKHGDPREGDHLNHDTLDNTRANLRIVTPQENKCNQPARGGYSDFVGVTWSKRHKRWQAQLGLGGRNIYLGQFNTAEAAARARDAYVVERATKHQLNFPAEVVA